MQEGLDQRKRLKTCVCLFPHSLHREYRKDIEKVMKDVWLGFCHEDIGYITSIIDDSLTIQSHSLIENGVWRLNVEVDANTIRPYHNSHLMARIQMINTFGIFLFYKDYLRIIIPDYFLKPQYEFKKQFSGQAYQSTTSSLVSLQVGDEILTEIHDFRFEHDHFSCIGRIVRKV